MALLAGLVLEVVDAAAVALGADLVPPVADPAGDRVASLDHAARAVALLAVGLEDDGRDVAVVGVEPLRLCHEAVSPVLVGVEERVLGPQRVHDLPDSLLLTEALILTESLVLTEPLVLILPEALVLVLPPLVRLSVSPLIGLIWLILSPLVGLSVVVVSPLIGLIVAPLVCLIGLSRLILLSVSPLIGLVISPLVGLVGLVGLIRLVIAPLIGLVVAPLSLSLSLLVPHVIFYCKDM